MRFIEQVMYQDFGLRARMLVDVIAIRHLNRLSTTSN